MYKALQPHVMLSVLIYSDSRELLYRVISTRQIKFYSVPHRLFLRVNSTLTPHQLNSYSASTQLLLHVNSTLTPRQLDSYSASTQLSHRIYSTIIPIPHNCLSAKTFYSLHHSGSIRIVTYLSARVSF